MPLLRETSPYRHAPFAQALLAPPGRFRHENGLAHLFHGKAPQMTTKAKRKATRKEAPLDEAPTPSLHTYWKACLSDHATTIIPLRLVAIDKGIVPVVKWLNAFDDTFTLYSCQGDSKHRPMIAFFCRWKHVLNRIKKEISAIGGKIDRPDKHPNVITPMLVIEFPSTKSLAKLKKRLRS